MVEQRPMTFCAWNESWGYPLGPAQVAIVEYGVCCMRYAEIPSWKWWQSAEKERRRDEMIAARARIQPFLTPAAGGDGDA